MTEKTAETTVAKENKFKKLLTLDPIFINKLEPKLKPIIKPIYFVLSIVLALMLVRAIKDLLTADIYAFVMETVLVGIYFIVVRMFAEHVQNG